MLNTVGLYAASGGLLDWVNTAANRATDTITAVVVVVGLVVGIIIAVSKRTMGSVIMGLVVGGIICAIPFLIPMAGDMAENEVGATGAGLTVSVGADQGMATRF